MKAKQIIIFILWMLAFAGIILTMVRAGKVRNDIVCKEYSINVDCNHLKDTLFCPSDVKKIVLKHDSLIGKPYIDIDIFSLESALKSQPYIADATIFGNMAGALKISVTQRAPVVRIINEKNEQFYLDKTGHPMPVRLGLPVRVITANGKIAESCEQMRSDTAKQTLKALIHCAECINNDDFLRNQIGQIYVEAPDHYLLIPVIGNHVIILGDPENPEARLERLKIFYQKGMDEEGWKKYTSIDLRFKSQVVCKK